MKLSRIATLLGASVLALAATATAQTRLVIGHSAEAVSLDPRTVNDVPSFLRIQTLMEPLVTFSPEMDLVPRLASAYDFSEDGSRLTFFLREDVTFHDGTPFTAEDVRGTFDWLLDEANDSVHRPIYEDVERLEVTGEHEVVFHLASPNAFVLNNIALMPIVKAGAGEDIGENPVGTGPLVFESWTRDDALRLRANPDYWGGAPSIDEVEFRTIPDNSARLLAFEAGELDLYQDNVVPSSIAELEADERFGVQRMPGLSYTYVGFNMEHEALSDVRVRQAISHLVPRDAIIERLLEGLAEEANSPFPSNSPWYVAELPRYAYDPERARELLSEAGYGEGELSLRLHTNQNPLREQIAEILEFELSQVGVGLEIQIEEWGAFLSRVQDSDDFDMFILGWSRNVDPDRAIARQFTSTGGSNDVGYRNERVDELVREGRSLPLLEEAQVELYREAQELIVADAPYAFIFFDEEVGLHQADLSGWVVHPYTTATFQDIHLFEKGD